MTWQNAASPRTRKEGLCVFDWDLPSIFIFLSDVKIWRHNGCILCHNFSMLRAHNLSAFCIGSSTSIFIFLSDVITDLTPRLYNLRHTKLKIDGEILIKTRMHDGLAAFCHITAVFQLWWLILTVFLDIFVSGLYTSPFSTSYISFYDQKLFFWLGYLRKQKMAIFSKVWEMDLLRFVIARQYWISRS